LAGSFQGRIGEKEKPWIRSGQAGSISGRFNRAQQLVDTIATAMQIKTFILVIEKTRRVPERRADYRSWFVVGGGDGLSREIVNVGVMVSVFAESLATHRADTVARSVRGFGLFSSLLPDELPKTKT
jgi:hypothetical protein